jgi:hypothetical protein
MMYTQGFEHRITKTIFRGKYQDKIYRQNVETWFHLDEFLCASPQLHLFLLYYFH